MPGVKNIIAVGAGKGGVGKTTVAVNLAIALSQRGGRVAMIDGDIYGPNVPIMLGIRTQLETDGKKIVPAEQYGIQLVSMAFLTSDDAPVIWRGPMLHGVDPAVLPRSALGRRRLPDRRHAAGHRRHRAEPEPDGAGRRRGARDDAADGVAGRHAARRADVSEAEHPDARADREHEPFRLPDCGHESDIFGKGGGEALAKEMAVPFLGRIPIYEPIRVGGDTGVPIVVGEPESPGRAGVSRAAERARGAAVDRRVQQKPIPLTPV